MSNIRPIGDPSLATAMLATFQSIDSARSAPAGISSPRWRILQCIAKAAPNVPNMGELRLCSGLNRAALAEHLQALRWKGLIEMDGLRLSPSAAAMVGPAKPDKSPNWIEDRFQRLAGAIAYLKSQAILVTVIDRDAPIRECFVSGKRYRQLAEEVIEIAIAKGWAE